MNWVLLSFLGTAGVVIVAVCIVALFVRHRFNRHHRVHPKVPTPAPATWLVDPRAPARLHRRLAKVGRTAGSVADDHRIPKKPVRRAAEQPPMVDLAEQLRQQAVNLDHRLARTAQLSPAVRRSHLLELAASVSDAELACVRLVSVSAQVRTPATLAGQPADITDVRAQVERLTEAHRLLQQIDADAGLVPQALPPAPTVARR